MEVRTNQILQVMNYYLVSAAVLFASYFAAISARIPLASAALAAIGFMCVVLFGAVHIQARKTIRMGEVALIEMQRRLAVATDCPELRLQQLSSVRGPRILVKDLDILAYALAGVMWLCAFTYAAMLIS
jgi:hypothetical protein